jgi:hypothetical protein
MDLAKWLRDLATEIETASRVGDPVVIAKNFTETGTLAAESRALEVGTPTLANTNAVLATLIRDLRYGGTRR